MSLKRSLKVPLSMRKFPMYMINRGPTLVIKLLTLAINLYFSNDKHSWINVVSWVYSHACLYTCMNCNKVYAFGFKLNNIMLCTCKHEREILLSFYFLIGWMQFLCVHLIALLWSFDVVCASNYNISSHVGLATIVTNYYFKN
jgi:hypothetical protein